MGWLRRWLEDVSETDEERLAEELHEWAARVPDTTRINDLAPRTRARVVGVVRRVTVRPVEGFEAFEVVLYDGTAELTAVWLGRRRIEGLKLGTRLMLEGVVGEERGERRLVNPTFEFV